MTRFPITGNEKKKKNFSNRAGPTMAFVVVALQTTLEPYTFCTSDSIRNSSLALSSIVFWWLSSPGPPFLASILNLSVSGVL